MTREEVLRRAASAVERARCSVEDVEFTPEDASRTEPEFLAEVVECAVRAGASTINVTDTVGYAMPEEFAALIRYLKTQVRGIDDVVLSAHCHDDLGLAVANSLAALRAGARAVECTINGIGERAGNCALEEVAMAIATRTDYLAYRTAIDTRFLCPVSRLLSQVTGLEVQRNKAIVGANAFAHEAGMHQHGMLMNSSTYQIICPEDVGAQPTQLVLGKHSGKHGLAARLRALGYEPDGQELAAVFKEFKLLADRRKQIYDSDLESILSRQGVVRTVSAGGGDAYRSAMAGGQGS
jgi:2-isopropylmalate synthase